jgi:hypothetical protein
VVEDKFQNSSGEIEIYEPKVEVRLICDTSYYGQCTCGDWRQLNHANTIALGYTNGSINLYYMNVEFYYRFNSNSIDVLPYKTINAHLTFVKTLKWSKTNENILASGALFSREIK